MIKHWSRTLWLVALCAVLCATLTTARPDFQKRSNVEGGFQETSRSSEELPSEEGNNDSTSQSPETSSLEDKTDDLTSQSPETSSPEGSTDVSTSQSSETSDTETSTDVFSERPQGPEGPPIDENPDCNGTKPDNYIYRNCTDVCQGDEVILQQAGRPCWLTWPTSLTASLSSRSDQDLGTVGVCADGQCIPRNDSGSGSTEGPTERPEEPEESLEKCFMKILKKFLKDLMKMVKQSILKEIPKGRPE